MLSVCNAIAPSSEQHKAGFILDRLPAGATNGDEALGTQHEGCQDQEPQEEAVLFPEHMHTHNPEEECAEPSVRFTIGLECLLQTEKHIVNVVGLTLIHVSHIFCTIQSS